MFQETPIQLLQRQRLLLQMEYYAEKETFRKQTEATGMQRKVKRGDAWFPIKVGKRFYNGLNQLCIEVFRTQDSDIEHNFECGEPLLNVANVVPAMEIMLDDFAYGLSKRRVTLSTSGVVPALDNLSKMIDVALAISLHAPNDELRDEIVPLNKKYNIKTLIDSVNRYLSVSNANHGKVTIEYVMLDHVNDHVEHAHQLAEVLKNTPCKINLIPWNPFPEAPYAKSSNTRIDRFQKTLMEYGLTVIVRKTRGDDIDAACGQLAGDVIDRTKRTAQKKRFGEAIAVQVQ